MANLAIIPARGGSQRIPRKNVKSFLGRPILEYPIAAALSAGIFDRVIVSTDDEEIATIAREAGAEVPFLRSSQNSSDTAGIATVVLEVLSEYRSKGIAIQNVACIYATAALLDGSRLNEAYKLFSEEDADAMIAILPYGHPIQRALKISSGHLAMAEPSNRTIRSQDLPPRYHDAGQFYLAKASALEAAKAFLNCPKVIPFELKREEAQDIDTMADWRLAELKYRAIYER